MVDSGKGQATYTGGGPVRQSYARVDYISQSGTKNLATDILLCVLYSINTEFSLLTASVCACALCMPMFYLFLFYFFSTLRG
jgi:hypothetical protein